jgi:hypothetical protein
LCGSGKNLRHPVHCNRFYKCNFDGWNISISVSQCQGEDKVFEDESQECVDIDDASEGKVHYSTFSLDEVVPGYLVLFLKMQCVFI